MAQIKPRSILGQVRSEGYYKGWSQAGQIKYDHAFDLGRQVALADAPSRLRWFLFGAATATLITWWII